MKSLITRIITLFTLNICISMISTTISAANALDEPENTNNASVIEEIVVTANRRQQNAQDVGIAVTAVSGDVMSRQNLVRAEQLDRIFPGFMASPNSGSSVSAFTIRGVGQSDFTPHQEQPNATYQDGVYVASADAIGMPLFDLQRVELLRGPQSTLFGRNATGGVIQFISNQPTEETNGSLEGTVGSKDLIRAQGYLNGALSDSIWGRLAFYYLDKDGFINNHAGESLLSEETKAIRGQMRFEIGDHTELTLRADGFDQDGTAFAGKPTPSYADENGVSQFLPPDVDAFGTGPGNDFFGYRDRDSNLSNVTVNEPGDISKEVRNIAATLNHSFNGIDLISITAYSDVKSNYFEDTDSSPYDQTLFGTTADSNTVSQEIRLQQAKGKLEWTAGLYYLNIDGDYSVFFDLPTAYEPFFTGGTPATGARYTGDYSLETTSYAIFGQVEYQLTEKMKFIAGGRYTDDDQNFSYIGTCTETNPAGCEDLFAVGVGVLGGDGTPIISDLGLIKLKQSDGDWSGKLALEYSPNDDLLLYASASKGLKSGGFTASADGLLTVSQLPFKPENLYAYEIGEKSTFADGRVVLNTSLYYYDYRNFQTFEFSGISTTVLNRPANANGGEIELTALLGYGVTGRFGAAYSDFEVEDIVTPTAPDGEKQRPVNMPKWTLNWTFTKDFEVSGDWSLRLLYGGKYTSKRFYNVVNVPVVEGPSFSTHDASLTLESNSGSGWWLSIFANNFTNEKYVNFAFDLTGLGYSLQHVGETRVIGATVGMRF